VKRALPFAALALILIGVGVQFVPEDLFGPAGPLDLVVAVYESENQPVDEASVLNGQTANALRKLSKWRQFDKDALPDKLQPALSDAVAKLGVPCVVLFRSGKVAGSVALPKSDADLDALIRSKEGI